MPALYCHLFQRLLPRPLQLLLLRVLFLDDGVDVHLGRRGGSVGRGGGRRGRRRLRHRRGRRQPLSGRDPRRLPLALLLAPGIFSRISDIVSTG